MKGRAKTKGHFSRDGASVVRSGPLGLNNKTLKGTKLSLLLLAQDIGFFAVADLHKRSKEVDSYPFRPCV